MPLTPDANLDENQRAVPETVGARVDVLDQLLGLDVGHTVHTGDTITMRLAVSDMNCHAPTRPQEFHLVSSPAWWCW